MNCGAKLPPMPKKEKKKNKLKKKSKAKILIPLFILLILVLLTFMVYGGDKVPEKIRTQKGYAYLTGMVKEKLPDEVKLPFGLSDKFNFDFSFQLPFDLPFDLPNPGDLFGGSRKSDSGKTAKTEAAENEGSGESKNAKNRESKETSAEENDTAKTGEEEADQNAEEIKKVYSKEDEKTITAGVDDSAVLDNQGLFTDGTTNWKYNKVKIQEHHTDLSTGTDTVVVYLEMENNYVNMAGTKEITYQFDEQSGKWTAGPVSKITCLNIEPVNIAQ